MRKDSHRLLGLVNVHNFSLPRILRMRGFPRFVVGDVFFLITFFGFVYQEQKLPKVLVMGLDLSKISRR